MCVPGRVVRVCVCVFMCLNVRLNVTFNCLLQQNVDVFHRLMCSSHTYSQMLMLKKSQL
jgi:hypothetical protein